MKAQWLKFAARYDALQLRERWLVALGVLGGIVLLTYSLVVEPALKAGIQAERNAVDQRAQLAGVQAQLAFLQSPERSPDVAARAELSALKQQLADLAVRLQTMEEALVPPEQMTVLLEDMVGAKSGVRLMSLKTLPVAPLLGNKANAEGNAAPASKPAAPSAGLFRHGVEIRLEGSYADLTAYLERLEQSKMKLLWSSVALSAEKHPKLVLTLTVNTLSLDRTWLIV